MRAAENYPDCLPRWFSRVRTIYIRILTIQNIATRWRSCSQQLLNSLKNDQPNPISFRNASKIKLSRHFRLWLAFLESAHEIMVRFTKLFYRLLGVGGASVRQPTAEVLRTLLQEGASLLNSRPLPYVNWDVTDDLSLTLNELLDKPPTADVPSGIYDETLLVQRNEYVKQLANLFWNL